jgi:hypothetical protein
MAPGVMEDCCRGVVIVGRRRGPGSDLTGEAAAAAQVDVEALDENRTAVHHLLFLSV